MKFKFRCIVILLINISIVGGCKKRVEKEELSNTAFIHNAMGKLTDVMVHDIFSPPVASRIYAYSSIAAYEALLPQYPNCRSLSGQLNELDSLPHPESGQEYCFPLASVHAFLAVGRTLTFSGNMIDEFEPGIYQQYKDMGISDDVYDRSIQYGAAVATKILEWAGRDGYRETRGFRYTVTKDPAKWKPTPPAYMDAVEPNWYKIRPFVLDTSSQFKPPIATSFSMEKGSKFYEEVMEVYEATKNLTEEQKAIASFWDCNPFVMHQTGHVMYASKKISPGGHWMNIAGVASKKAKADLMKTVETYMLVSISLADGFISCWDEKYRSAVIRPETIINSAIDENWQPLLQTPPFPEYPSGHSVVSNAAAITLTSLYGDSFSFIDSTETKYGLPSRNFKSFQHAADEAAISRLYGGIHFRPAIINGSVEGKQVGTLVTTTLKTRNQRISHKNN